MEEYYWLIGITIAALAAVKAKKLTINAGILGFICGVMILWGVGYPGIVFMATFFMLGTLATAWKLRNKQEFGLAEDNKGKRTVGQVLANAGVAMGIASLAVCDPVRQGVYGLMIAGSFSSATADTLSSELGNVYGRKFYNIISFKKDSRGLDGVISLEGTLAGLLGAAVIAAVYCLLLGRTGSFWVIVLAGLVGNLIDSVLGATFERKGVVGNNAVNFLNTAVGALVVLLCS